MSPHPNTEHTRTTTRQTTAHIHDWANAFYLAKRVEGLSNLTLIFYRQQLMHFIRYCDAQVITSIDQLTPAILRSFLLAHEERGHNPGGVHGVYRVVKTFLRWYETEAEPEGWQNPISKVKAPRLAELTLEPVKLDVVQALLKTCDRGLLGMRDRAILLALLDTGTRATELLALDIDDVDPITGAALIRRGKGGKPRTVYLGKKARQALRRYLATRQDGNPALWVTKDDDRLSYGGLRGMIVRRAHYAGVAMPALHSFRRAFALNCLRAGMDVYSLQKLMGHSDLQVLRRYLAQTTDDLRVAHGRASPADQL